MAGFGEAFAAARKAHGGDGGTFTYKGKSYTTDLAKSAAKKGVEKAAGGGFSGKAQAANAALNAAGIDAGEMTSDLVGGGAGGGAAEGAINAGIASGFNPYVMAAGAVMGFIGGREKEKQAIRMGKAKGKMEQAKGEYKKADIYGKMAESIRGSLGGAQRKRSVNL